MAVEYHRDHTAATMLNIMEITQLAVEYHKDHTAGSRIP